MKCKNCGYWGGSGSKGDYRKCYKIDAMSNTKPELKHCNDTCEWKKDQKKLKENKS